MIVEGVLDIILIDIYTLDKLEKYSGFELLSKITFRDKIDVLDKIKKSHLQQKPPEYIEHIVLRGDALAALTKKYGKNFLYEIEEINIKLNLENGVYKPLNYYSILKSNKENYISDSSWKMLKRINLNNAKTILALRNIVAHRWNNEEPLMNYLKCNHAELDDLIYSKSIEIINEYLYTDIK